MVTAVGVVLVVLAALFAGLCATGLGSRMAAARAARRRRRARTLLTALASGGAAARGTGRSGAPLSLARELAAIVPDSSSALGSRALARARRRLRRQLVAQLASRAGRWRGAKHRRVRLRSELLAGLELLEELPAEEELPLVVQLLHLADVLVVARAAAVVARRPQAYAGALVPLAGVLRDAAPLSRPHLEHALRALATAHPEMIPLLASDPSPRVRRNVVHAAGTALTGRAPGVGPELQDGLTKLIISGARDPDEGVRAVACRSLQPLPPPRRLAELERLLHDGCAGVRVAATQSLRALPDPGAIPLLVARLEGAPPALTREILRSLSAVTAPPRSEIDRLIGRLAQGKRIERVAALRALGALGGEAEAHRIVELVKDPNPKIRLEASLALASIGRLPELPLRGTEVVQRLCDRLLQERNERVAAALVEALASSGDVQSTAPMMARIESSSPVLREQLVEGLALLDLLMTAGERAHGMA